MEHKHLFDPDDPLNTKNWNSPPLPTESGIRFQPMREMITLHKATISLGAKRGVELSAVETVGTQAAQSGDTHFVMWEQMICQLSNNATNLLQN